MSIGSLKIRGKMLALLCSSTLVTIALAFFLIGQITKVETLDSAQREGLQISKAVAKDVQNFLAQPLVAARLLSQTLTSMKTAGDINRDNTIAMLKHILESNPEFLGVWVGFEPNAFDGRDADFAGKANHDATGRFVPYLNRVSGQVAYDTLPDYDKDGAGDYYLVSQKTGKEYITEPTSYEVGGKSILMTSLTVPIFYKDKVIGVAGIDIGLNELSTRLADIKVLKTGFVSLISNGGLWAGGESAKRMGQSITSDGQTDFVSVVDDIKAGRHAEMDRHSARLGRDVHIILEPVSIGNTGRSWSVPIRMPIDELLETSNKISQMLMIAAIAILAVLFVLVMIVARIITKPISIITEQIGELGQGRTDIDIYGTNRTDEIGEMAGNLEIFRKNLVHTHELEEQQKQTEIQAAKQRKKDMLDLASRFEDSVMGIVKSVAASSTEMQSTAASMSNIAGQTNAQAASVAAASTQASANVETVATATEELSASVQEISARVTDAARIATQAADESARTAQTVKKLAEASTKIGEVVELINDIASQTNLLALNATIEAARAGEAGKGFAVVASEVKGLAGQTAKATEEISGQIAAVQSETNAAVKAIGDISQIIDQVRDISTNIASAVEEQEAATKEIARNVQQASSGTHDVSQNIVSVTESAAQTGHASQEVLETAGELAKNAEGLRHEVETFLQNIRQS